MLFGVLPQAYIIMLFVSLVIPLISSYLSKQHWPGHIVGILTLLLSSIAGFLTQWAHTSGPFDFKAAFNLALSSFLVAVLGGRVAIWKGTPADAWALSHGNTSNVVTLPATPPPAPPPQQAAA